jgi:hypothetical protein
VPASAVEKDAIRMVTANSRILVITALFEFGRLTHACTTMFQAPSDPSGSLSWRVAAASGHEVQLLRLQAHRRRGQQQYPGEGTDTLNPQ